MPAFLQVIGVKACEGNPEKVHEVEVRELDLGSLDSVRSFAKVFNSEHRRLDLLICNAGIMAPPERSQTADGLEQQFQVYQAYVCSIDLDPDF